MTDPNNMHDWASERAATLQLSRESVDEEVRDEIVKELVENGADYTYVDPITAKKYSYNYDDIVVHCDADTLNQFIGDMHRALSTNSEPDKDYQKEFLKAMQKATAEVVNLIIEDAPDVYDNLADKHLADLAKL